MNLYRVTWQMSAYIDSNSDEEAVQIAKDGNAEDTEFLLYDVELIEP